MSANIEMQHIPAADNAPVERRDSSLSMIGGDDNPAANIDIALSWKDISFGAGERNILNNLTGTALPCRLLVIMGKSGAGKTTLLKLLADRLDTGGDRRATGDILVNNVPLEYKDRGLLAFVPQDDILDGHSTPSEVLSFSLRVRRGLSVERTARHVDRTLEELGLAHVRDTVIGVPGETTGLSGGERKRANIGVELITQPKIMLLDEPTTGLDSVTAARVSQMMQKLARNGRTILCTLHQPTAEMLQYFDDLLLLASGCVVYHGPMSDAVAYFTSIGYECPEDYTPTDYFMALIQDNELCPKLIDAWTSHVTGWRGNGNAHGSIVVPARVTATPEETKRYLDTTTASLGSTWTVQFSELLQRAALDNIRDRAQIIGQFTQSVLFAAFVSILYNNLTNDVTGLTDRMGLFFMITINASMSTISSMVHSFPAIKAVYIRDQQSDSYEFYWYYLAKSIADLPLQFMTLALQVIIVYFSTKLVVDAGNFFIYWAVMLLLQQVCVGLGLALSAAAPNEMVATTLMPVIIMPLMLAGGLMVSSDRLDPYWVWLNRISFIRQGFMIIARREYNHMGVVRCDSSKMDCSGQPKTGAAAVHAYGLDGSADQDWVAWMCLAIEFVVFRLLALIALWRAGKAKE